MDLKSLLAGLKRSSKDDDIPGTVAAELDEICPSCGKKMKQYKACCGAPYGYKGCNCGYKVYNPGTGN